MSIDASKIAAELEQAQREVALAADAARLSAMAADDATKARFAAEDAAKKASGTEAENDAQFRLKKAENDAFFAQRVAGEKQFTQKVEGEEAFVARAKHEEAVFEAKKNPTPDPGFGSGVMAAGLGLGAALLTNNLLQDKDNAVSFDAGRPTGGAAGMVAAGLVAAGLPLRGAGLAVATGQLHEHQRQQQQAANEAEEPVPGGLRGAFTALAAGVAGSQLGRMFTFGMGAVDAANEPAGPAPESEPAVSGSDVAPAMAAPRLRLGAPAAFPAPRPNFLGSRGGGDS